MNEKQRTRLLEQATRTSATLGGSIPDTVTVNGEGIPLLGLVEVASRDDLDESQEARIEEVLRYLRRERLRLTQRIQNDDVDYGEGEELVERIQKLDRAVNAFESLDGPSFGEEVRRERIQSAEELVDMLRQFTAP